jgi:hypothetical protein
MSFLRQLFGRRSTTTEQKLARINHRNIVTYTDYEIDWQEEGLESEDNFFDYIIGYNDVKKFLRMSINTEEPVHTFDWPTSFSKDNVYQIYDEAQ